MRILFLANANSIHTTRWVISLAQRGIEICLFSLEENKRGDYKKQSNITIINGEYKNASTKDGEMSKLALIKYLPKLIKSVKVFNPDIIHAHYATSYGLLGSLLGFHPYIISVWGSDVYDFPNISPIHKTLLKFNFKKADYILSTSHIMAKETYKYTSKPIGITPFGVDTDLFKKNVTNKSDEFIVGNVKTLSPIYGIDILIKAFAKVFANNPDQKMRLVIVGDGPNKDDYINLTKELKIEKLVDFKGIILNNELAEKCYNKFSVSVSVSVSESFGVVAVEAMACECPVIVSDADGFTEIVEDGKTGFIVPKRNIEATSNAIQRFIDNPSLRESMGKQGRERVLELYDWQNNVNKMFDIYTNIINQK